MRTIFLVHIKGQSPKQFDDIEKAVEYKQSYEMADMMNNLYEPSDYRLSLIHEID